MASQIGKKGTDTKRSKTDDAIPEIPTNLPIAYLDNMKLLVNQMLTLPALSPEATTEEHKNHDALFFHVQAQNLMIRWQSAHLLTTHSFAMLLRATTDFIEKRRKLFLKPVQLNVNPSASFGKTGFVYPLD
jgi:hypothetical protein